MVEIETYEEQVKVFNKISSLEAEDILSKEDITAIYIGRATCPFCRKFVKKLSDISKEINKTIYYIDSSNSSDEELSSFRKKYNILTVPGFIVSKNNEIEVRCDSSTPEEEILYMLK
ncbi:thiol reductase thioredoxin [Clostridium sp. Sa3CUN1]|uniref:Thiol reductase thioredoxin n=1 Tax=Clostridium gallinarum TaxID=2762246 RepID=A0ABR8Q6E3_9CLOT|nr:thiol reductase thioredoxin [Clostridium gallinarum]MBD7915970.1 thiol reductase thioredoxin [Clostridium gallinarum]